MVHCGAEINTVDEESITLCVNSVSYFITTYGITLIKEGLYCVFY